MVSIPFEFSPYKDTPLEISMGKDLKVLSKYIWVSKNDCHPMYVKFDNNDEFKEIYPHLINNDINLSIEELNKRVPYEDFELDESNWYLSYDLVNFPTEVYSPDVESSMVYKFRKRELETVYFVFQTYREFENSPFYKEFRFQDKYPIPDYIIIQNKKGFDNIILLGYFVYNENYSLIKNDYFSNFNM